MKETSFKYVLVAGPDCRNHRGGIGAVIASHGRFFKPFQFISTYKTLPKYLIPLYSLVQIMRIGGYLLFNPGIKMLHLHGASAGSFYRKYIIFLIARYIFSKKIIYHIHGGGFHLFYKNASPFIQRRIRHFINNADAIICLSETWAEFFRLNFQPKRTEIMHNFIELPDEIPASNHVNLKPVTFLFLGKVEKDKGVYDLVDTAELIRTGFPGQFELWIGGNGETVRLEQLIRSRKLEDTVKFLGWVSGSEKNEILRQSDVYVLPSYAEGMPVSILEAMAHQMPVISTKVGSIPELVLDKVSGYLIAPGDTNSLRKYMELFITDRQRIRNMGNLSAEIVKRNYSASPVINKIKMLYKDLLCPQLQGH